MRKLLLGLPLVVMALPAFAAESAAAKQIRAADAKWVAAAQKRDVKGWMSFYAKGALLAPPNEKMCDTPAKVRTLIQSLLSLPDLNLSWEPVSIEVGKSGDLAYSLNQYFMTYTGPDGETMADRGKNTEIWKKQKDGSWKCVIDTWNSDLPLDPTLAEWQSRYEVYCANIRAKRSKAWQQYIWSDVTWVKADGTLGNRADLMKETLPLFDAKKIEGSETVLKVTREGSEFEIAYSQDWKLTMPNGSLIRITGSATDVWKKIDGKWRLVKVIEPQSK